MATWLISTSEMDGSFSRVETRVQADGITHDAGVTSLWRRETTERMGSNELVLAIPTERLLFAKRLDG